MNYEKHADWLLLSTGIVALVTIVGLIVIQLIF